MSVGELLEVCGQWDGWEEVGGEFEEVTEFGHVDIKTSAFTTEEEKTI